MNEKAIDSLLKTPKINIRVIKFDNEEISLGVPEECTFFDLKCHLECYFNKVLNKKKKIHW